MIIRAERDKGFFVAFDYSSDALTEIDRFFRQTAISSSPSPSAKSSTRKSPRNSRRRN
jgi:hypothetical protein